jgi:hypothetical protein
MGVHEEDIVQSSTPTLNEDDRELESFGYVASFKREFSNLATVSTSTFPEPGNDAFPRLVSRSASWYTSSHDVLSVFLSNLQGLCSSIATTFNTPLLLGGPASVRLIRLLTTGSGI